MLAAIGEYQDLALNTLHPISVRSTAQLEEILTRMATTEDTKLRKKMSDRDRPTRGRGQARPIPAAQQDAG